MATKKRHPVLWPQMKIRGRRRRLAAEQRFRTVTIIPFLRPVPLADGAVRFEVLSRYEPGAVSMRTSVVRDGFGRTIRVVTT